MAVAEVNIELNKIIHIGLDVLDLTAMEEYSPALPANAWFVELLDGFYCDLPTAQCLAAVRPLPS